MAPSSLSLTTDCRPCPWAFCFHAHLNQTRRTIHLLCGAASWFKKAVQQLLFDVDWSSTGTTDNRLPPLDALVLDLPPGTGDVPLSLGQLVHVDGAVIVSTPQDVALADVRKGIAMLRKLSVPITGLVLNLASFVCSSCQTPHRLFGPTESFHEVASRLEIPVLGELPLVPGVSIGGDGGVPFALTDNAMTSGGQLWNDEMNKVAVRIHEQILLD
ncbi:P-loop containing nucleoside triphosphate hydrolase protein [Mycena kentingensis (nom. inval.)]|nr:P-loop containing nucleoside triphosphate hydrolase protein [Mycena kentingensis (nom. inval.)]